MYKSAFYISKPLQYFNATNIEDPNEKVCIIVDHFSGARELYEKLLNRNSQWNQIIFVPNPKAAYVWMQENSKEIDRIYIDSDVGVLKNIWLYPLRRKQIIVYEEGLGSYRSDLRPRKALDLVVEFLLNIVGIRSFFGGSVFTNAIYLYDHDSHKKNNPSYQKARLHFKRNFLEHLNHFEDKNLFLDEESYLVIEQACAKKVILYLTSWQYNSAVEHIINDYPGYMKLIKPHPHIKSSFSQHLNMFHFVVGNAVMVEFLLLELAKVAEKVVVLHENSSAMHYFSNLAHVENRIFR